MFFLVQKIKDYGLLRRVHCSERRKWGELNWNYLSSNFTFVCRFKLFSSLDGWDLLALARVQQNTIKPQ